MKMGLLLNGWMKMFKSDFPIFQNHPELVFLDSAASAQKPKCALDAMINFYTHSYSNVHRGNCEIAGQATELYENARQVVAEFIGTTPKNIVFTSGATAAVAVIMMIVPILVFVITQSNIIETMASSGMKD